MTAKDEKTALRWKTKRIKIHRLGFRFSMDFKTDTLGYRFLFLEITHIWQKSPDFWFADFFS
jgi:hypothetical protein